ncbi:DUF5343 domain-containing protein [Isoptericola sp. AK164]|uniref:DUF5343 domain-containing protein n=1 Tax=Isoptericola sp. AK164 TaxID=3024246 RepID=UPI0024184D52|nr:DUF5343 domain-containing protein [Isoptericola sp. AK164]
MADDFPYLPSATNIPGIFEKMRTAGTPPKFNLEFLSKTLGFNSSQDRGMHKILKRLGFLSQDGTPTQRYNDYKSTSRGGRALAQGLREGWKDLFLANESVYRLNSGEIADICKSVTGTGDSVAQKMATTFVALANLADWSDPAPGGGDSADEVAPEIPQGGSVAGQAVGIGLHQDIHVHLPPTSDVSVYRAIFQALREELM